MIVGTFNQAIENSVSFLWLCKEYFHWLRVILPVVPLRKRRKYMLAQYGTASVLVSASFITRVPIFHMYPRYTWIICLTSFVYYWAYIFGQNKLTVILWSHILIAEYILWSEATVALNTWRLRTPFSLCCCMVQPLSARMQHWRVKSMIGSASFHSCCKNEEIKVVMKHINLGW